MNVSSELERYGVNRENIRDLSAPRPEVLEYLDLVNVEDGEELRPDGVIESSNRPLLYYVNASRLATTPNPDKGIKKLSRNVACRGERAYLAVVKPGLLDVTPVSLEDTDPSWRTFQADSTEAINFFANLVRANVPDDDLGEPSLVFDEMLSLLRTGIDRIRRQIGRENTLSLIGRALFFRFLCDRGIVTDKDVPKICQTANSIKAGFDNAENAYRTSRWLDETFNGDFLPFKDRGSTGGTRSFFEGLNDSKIVYQNLSAIIRGHEPVGSDDYQHRFDWATFDFAHVPVGLLSQVYEAFSWKWEEDESEATSVHYTPRHIATTIVDEVFDGLADPHKARVLDPACGAGVFLVLAFRRLYREHWIASGKRPDTKLIRRILEQQLCGFDISDSALRLAALSLYLTAIELDPKPVPPEKLRFNYLDDLTLFNHRREEDCDTGAVIGSLGRHVDSSFDGAFDVVISNPPWTRIRDDDELAIELNAVSKLVVAAYDEQAGAEYQNPDGVPDLPFLWRSTQWCKPSGRIAMAMPSRTLFKEGQVAANTRKSLFNLIKFTGIVNCSNLRRSNVWPDMDQPFMMIFAQNKRPHPEDEFWFISPQADMQENKVGSLRIDTDSARTVSVGEVLLEPWLLKTLTIGTSLDVQVARKIVNSKSSEIDEYWKTTLGLVSRKGYVVSSRRPPSDASLLHGMPDIGKADELKSKFVVDVSKCKPFKLPTLDETRIVDEEGEDPLQVYRGPLLLLRQSLRTDRQMGNALLCQQDAVFNQSFYGYSAKGHDDADSLTRYLQLFVHSHIWPYYLLCTSASVGSERPVIRKSDFDRCRLIPFENLSLAQRRKIAKLSKRLIAEESSVFKDIDEFFAEIFGLEPRDVQVIADTLKVRNPHDEIGRIGSARVDRDESAIFTKHLKRLLVPFAKRVGVEITVSMTAAPTSAAYLFLYISSSDAEGSPESVVDDSMLELATKTGASRIVRRDAGRLVVGILNQYRYWTPSRARLLAADILRDYFSVFEGAK